MNRNNSKMSAKKMKRKQGHGDSPHGGREKEPDLTIRLDNSSMLRKEVLEAVRELIIFMQGHEKFKKIQQEKLATFGQLKNDVKEINNLVEQKLKHLLPKGKLKTATLMQPKIREAEVMPNERVKERPVELPPEETEEPQEAEEEETPKDKSELDELEAQLQSIENQLKGM